MANKNAEILSAVKSAGEAALRLHEENESLRSRLAEAEALLREAVDAVESCHDCIRIASPELHARIDAYLGREP